MRIDKSKFTTEELAQYEKLIAKATVPDESPKPAQSEENKPEKSPKPSDESTQKSVEDTLPALLTPMQKRMEQLEKSLEMKDLLQVAEKYEIIGEKPEELAKNLYELKKSSETNYNAYLAMLDKALALAQKSELFTEIGKDSHDGETGGGAVNKIQTIATELQKAEPTLNRVSAVRKAWELHPELVQEYDNDYFHRS